MKQPLLIQKDVKNPASLRFFHYIMGAGRWHNRPERGKIEGVI